MPPVTLTVCLCLLWPPACAEPVPDLLWDLPPAESYETPLPSLFTTNPRRIFTSPRWHVGVAGHTDGSGGAVTVQVSTTELP